MIDILTRRLQNNPIVVGEAGVAKTEVAELSAQLAALQGEAPLARVCVDEHSVGEVTSEWMGIPIGKMAKGEVGTVLSLEGTWGSG